MTDDKSVNPLRTFELSTHDWKVICDAVESEGQESWSDYASTIVAAIELGYLDEHLHMLGLFLRERYFHLKNGSPAPAYMSTSTQPGTGYTMITPPGVKPVRKLVDGEVINDRAFFVAQGHLFAVSDFVGKTFASVLHDGSVVLIESVVGDTFRCRVVSCASRPDKVDRMHSFQIERQGHLYDVPRSRRRSTN